jgi:adenine-specific DNA methylase
MFAVRCPRCGKPVIIGKDCGWCDEQIERGRDRALAGQAGKGVGEEGIGEKDEGEDIVSEGEEYSTSKDHFEAENKGKEADNGRG